MQWILKLRVYIIVLLAVLLISAAVTFSVLRAVLPHATGYKTEIQNEISRQIDLPVEIETIDAAIDWFSPRLRLIGVSVYDANKKFPLFTFEEAFVELDVVASIMHRELIVDDVGLVGTDLSIEKLSENEWSVQGLRFTSDGSSELPESLVYMLQNSDYLLHNSNIYYRDDTGDKLTLNLLDVNIDVNNSFGYHDIRFSMNLPEEYGEYLAIVASLSGDIEEIDGEVYVEAQKIKVDQWNRKFNLQDQFLVDANMDVDLWIELEDGGIESLVSRLSTTGFMIKNNATSQSWKTDYLSTNLRYEDDGDYQVINLSEFYFGDVGQADWPMHTNLIAGNDQHGYFFSADFLRVDELQEMARVFLDEDALSKADELNGYALQADIYNLNIEGAEPWVNSLLERQEIVQKNEVDKDQDQGEASTPATSPVPEEDIAIKQPELQENKSLAEVASLEEVSSEQEPVQASGSLSELDTEQHDEQREFIKELQDNISVQVAFDNLSFTIDQDQFRLAGLDASLQLKDGVVVVDLASDDVDVDIQELFRNPLHANILSGKVNLTYTDSGWSLSSDQLHATNDHIDTYTRVELELPDSGAILVDAQTDFYDAYGKYAKHYLPVGVMSPTLVEWLDLAVTSGYVPDGQFILQGDFNQFPFDDKDGVFQVLFHPQDVSMRFLEDWPSLENTSATVKFENRSLTVSGAKGTTMEASLRNGYAVIPDLTDPFLMVRTEASADNEDVQQYIWSSPLDEVLGDAMRLFQISGDSSLELEIDVPLNNKELDVAVDGHLVFNDSTIYYPALGYELTDINSSIDFTKHSISAQTSSAKIQGEEVFIGAHTREGESGDEVVFQLSGDMAADYLLQEYDWLPDEWFKGASSWSIDVEVPYQPDEYLVHIDAESDLQGIGILISDKVQKQTDEKSSLSVAIDVLDNDGLHVDASVNDPDEIIDDTVKLFTLYGIRDAGKLWRFDVASDYLSGKGEFTEGMDKTTTVSLDLDDVDLYAISHKDEDGEAQPIDPNNFPSLRWHIKNLKYNGWAFRNVLLETDWHKHGMLINNLSLTGPSMTFNASGTWLTSWSDKQETVLQGKMTSNDFGETLEGLGFERSVNRGALNASFNARWPAELYNISWANMKGESDFEIENGEILEVEPGAGGRLLGLLNIFKLTNRLAFDFHDVTRKGFSFDYIKGDFEFLDGKGTLNKFDVSAPAADINMFGSIGLIERDYGLLMRVKPHTDSLTFAGGALLGGVVVGASLALIQKVFDLGIIGHNVYSITGSWDDPEIEKIVERTIDTEEDEDF